KYCLQGETPILMADGGTKRLMDLRVGDAIYGTVRDGSHRHYVITEVLAHWRTVKSAYRVTLEDGTALVASGDHRFLTNRGWKHVTSRMNGAGRCPYLTTSDEFVGTGQFAAPPKDSTDYRRGYLCGLVRGDWRRGADRYHRFRLALIDPEARARARRYLADAGVYADQFEFPFWATGGERRMMPAIRDSTPAGFEAINGIIRWPECPGDAWSKGFLAGVFDAGGTCSRGLLRIASADSETIDSMVLS